MAPRARFRAGLGRKNRAQSGRLLVWAMLLSIVLTCDGSRVLGFRHECSRASLPRTAQAKMAHRKRRQGEKNAFFCFFIRVFAGDRTAHTQYGKWLMKVLVTGGAGYIGCVTVERLISEGHSVVVFDNLSQGHRAAVHSDATFIEGDLSEPDEIESAFSTHPIDAVMHFASRTLVGESMQKPFLY